LHNVHVTNKNKKEKTTGTSISLRQTQIVNNEIYISGAQDGNRQITLNQQKIINNIS